MAVKSHTIGGIVNVNGIVTINVNVNDLVNDIDNSWQVSNKRQPQMVQV